MFYQANSNMKRKTFLTLTVMGAATLTVPFLNCTTHVSDFDKLLSVPNMLSHLRDAKTIKEIGKAYGSKIPDEYSIKKIEALLVRNDEGTAITETTRPADIHAFINKNIRNDFTTGKTVIVKGWVLSVSEARQSALLSLIPS